MTAMSGAARAYTRPVENIPALLSSDANQKAVIGSDGKLLVPDEPGSIPVGGLAGEVLRKQSAIDYDVAWTPPGGGAGIQQITVNVPYGSTYAVSVSVPLVGVTPMSKIMVSFAGTDSTAENESDDVADWTVSAAPADGSVIFNFYCPGVFGGPVLLNYQLSL